jgi:hypothetical protein
MFSFTAPWGSETVIEERRVTRFRTPKVSRGFRRGVDEPESVAGAGSKNSVSHKRKLSVLLYTANQRLGENVEQKRKKIPRSVGVSSQVWIRKRRTDRQSMDQEAVLRQGERATTSFKCSGDQKRDVGGLGGRTAGTADPGEKHEKKYSPSRVFSRGLRTATA